MKNQRSSTITPVILAGGNGTRLWPLSRKTMPKQFASLTGKTTLFQETVQRFHDLEGYGAPIILTSVDCVSLVETQLADVGISAAAILSEPACRDTAPAILLAALVTEQQTEDDAILVMPSDHRIGDVDALRRAVEEGRKIAKDRGLLVTFGITPDRPSTQFGYIQTGDPIFGEPGHLVKRFVEKPNEETAKRYVADASFSWNSGMFLLPVSTFLAEMSAYQPQLLQTCKRAIRRSISDGLVIEPNSDDFAACEKISIDYALMEKTSRAAIVSVDPVWSDLGTWPAIADLSPADRDDNQEIGNVCTFDSKNNYVRSSGPMTTLVGMENCIVVNTGDAVLVASRDKADGVKQLVEKMEAEGRREVVSSGSETRPWGSFHTLEKSVGHHVKHLRVEAGGKLSLQKHFHRAENWVVVSGTARATVGDVIVDLKPGQSIFVPKGAIHRLENPGTIPVEIIEVQSGDYFGEDDIVRFDDVYGRAVETPFAVAAE